MIEEEMREKTKEAKVKLLLIKEILIYADKMKIKLPDDVVSKLLKESILVLKTLKKKGYDWKVAYYLDIVIQANIEEDKLKKQISDEIVEAGQSISSYSCPSMEEFHRYINSVIIFSTLELTRKQFLAYVQSMKDRRENLAVISIINQLHKYEFSNQEILSLLRPTYDPDTDRKIIRSYNQTGKKTVRNSPFCFE